MFNGGCPCGRGIEERAHAILGDGGVEHGLVELPYTFGSVGIDVDRQRAHLGKYLLVGQFQQSGCFAVGASHLLHHLAEFVTVDRRVFDGHRAQHVEVQLQHLPHFVVKRHLLEAFFHLLLYLGITRDGGTGGVLSHHCCRHGGGQQGHKNFLHVIGF